MDTSDDHRVPTNTVFLDTPHNSVIRAIHPHNNHVYECHYNSLNESKHFQVLILNGQREIFLKIN